VRRILLGLISLLVLSVTVALPWAAQPPDDWIMYVGTYTRAPSKGIYAYRWQPATGAVTPMGAAGLAVETENPSFLAVHPNQRFVYAVNEVSRYDGREGGSVSAFAVDRGSGKLTLLNRVPSRGADPCHLAVDASGKWLFVANYTGGSVAAFPVREDGSLGDASTFFQHSGSSIDKERQNGPHAHATVVSPDNRFVLAVDLGLDRVFSYRLDTAAGGLAGAPGFASAAPGSGPRHLAFRPDGRFAYVLNEMLSSVTAFGYDAARGALTSLQTLSTLPEGFNGQSSGAEIAVHPGGKFLYASNRGDDSIAMFRIDAAAGTLTPGGRVATEGKTPRGFAIDPSGRFLVAGNQNSASLVIFRIDQATGSLTATGTTVQVPSPVSVVFARPRS
jgi:6-phosphogluconolactonase